MVAKEELTRIFKKYLNRIGRQGDIGIANFKTIYNKLMPVQQIKLNKLCGEKLDHYMDQGSIISILITYYENEINSIAQRNGDGTINRQLWMIYAKAYLKLNRNLDEIAEGIASKINGISIPATIEGILHSISNVSEYYPQTISHRVVAEHAGLGWRGKNGLLIHPSFSCAFRLASIISPLSLFSDRNLSISCGECRACLDECKVLNKKEKLDHYQESCRKYLAQLNIPYEVCGKCIYVCYNKSKFTPQFQLKRNSKSL
jgi:epoxyqueuosine reductase QueG